MDHKAFGVICPDEPVVPDCAHPGIAGGGSAGHRLSSGHGAGRRSRSGNIRARLIELGLRIFL